MIKDSKSPIIMAIRRVTVLQAAEEPSVEATLNER